MFIFGISWAASQFPLRAGILRHNFLIRTLYFHFETPRKFGRGSLKNEGGFIGMEHRGIVAKMRYVISEVYM